MVKVVVAVVAVVVAVEVVAIVRVAGVVAGVSSSSSSSSGSGSSSRMSSSSKTKYHFRMCNFEKSKYCQSKAVKNGFCFLLLEADRNHFKPTEAFQAQRNRFT